MHGRMPHTGHMRTRTLTIDDDTQPRYVPEDVYFAPTAEDRAVLDCQHLTYRDGTCEDCGLRFWRVWF